MHREPPGPELELVVESVPVPESLDFFTDQPEERLLKTAWQLRELADRWQPDVWPWPR